MRTGDLVRTVLLNLKRMRFRVVLTVLGVVIGTTSVVVMISIGAGLQRNLTEELDAFGSMTQIDVSLAYEEPVFGGSGMAPGPAAESRPLKPLTDAALRDIERMPGVESAMGQHRLFADARFRRYATQVEILAVEPAGFRHLRLPVAEGRELGPGNEIVVGSAVPGMFAGDPFGETGERADVLNQRIILEVPDYETLAEDGEPVVHTLRVRVVGILEPVDPMTDLTVYLPSTAARPVLSADARSGYQQAIVHAESVDQVEAVTQAIIDAGFAAFSMRQMVESVQRVFTIVQIALGGIGGIALVVASLSIANTMTMATYERTREIGIMKAVGASRRQIMRIFLMESAFIGLLGGVIGLVLAVIVTSLGNLALTETLMGMSLFHIPIWLALYAVILSAVIGLGAGILPAVRASKLDPLTALRHE